MNEDELAVSDNSEEPQSDNQEQQTLLNLNAPQDEPEATEPEAMPHLETDEAEEEPIDWGDRPEWIPPELWSETDGPDVEKAFEELATVKRDYKELRTKMSQGLHKAPKDGEYTMDIMTDAGIENDDPMLEGYLEIAKKHGISQDAFNEIAEVYLASAGEMEAKSQETIAEQKAKLGPRADKIIAETEQWLMKFAQSNVLNDAEINAVANASTDASFITAMNKIRQSYNEAPIPSIEIQEGAQKSMVELQQLVADQRYGKDMAYTQWVEQQFMENVA